MKFNWCTIAVNDMGQSVAFYRDIVGLPVGRRFTAGSGVEICFLGDGETRIELLHDPDRKGPGHVPGISLGFGVPSLNDMLAFVQEKGITVTAGPIQAGPGVRFFYVKDPNGVSIQFVEGH